MFCHLFFFANLYLLKDICKYTCVGAFENVSVVISILAIPASFLNQFLNKNGKVYA